MHIWRRSCLALLLLPFLISCGDEEPQLWVSAKSIVLKNGLWSAQFVVMNNGGSSMDVQIDSTMVDVPTSRFSLEPGADHVVTITLRSDLRDTGYGTVDGQILVSAGAAGHVTIPVTANLTPPGEEADQANGNGDPNGGGLPDPNRTEFVWEAEDFDERVGNAPDVFEPPLQTSDGNGAAYNIPDASGDAFVGSEEASAKTGSLTYNLRIPSTGDWYIWGRAIGPPTGDNSFFWGIDLDDLATVDGDPNSNIWDFNEAAGVSLNFPLGNPAPEAVIHGWAWYLLSSREGPFPGTGDVNNPIPLELTAGTHTFLVAIREDGAYLDAFYATKSANSNPNDDDPVAAPGRQIDAW